MVSVQHNRVLSRLYNTPEEPHSFGGFEALYKRAKIIDSSISKQVVCEFLKNAPAYTLHKNTFKRFRRRRVIASRPKSMASCDLADMRSLSKYNDGIKYILVVIDIFSRYLEVIPLMRKDGLGVANALKNILDGPNFIGLRHLNSDLGLEFYNRNVSTYLKSKDIVLYSVHSREIKASIAERVIRTLKGKIYRYMTHRNTFKYLDVLTKLVKSYNNSVHRGLTHGQTPKQVHNLCDNDRIKEQFNRMYKNDIPHESSSSSSLVVGQTVRLADTERNAVFRRGFVVQNTIEIFRKRELIIAITLQFIICAI